MEDYQDLSEVPVQKSPCLTCPFEGKKPISLNPKQHALYIKNLLGSGQHMCHSVNNTMICRGGRNIQLRFLYEMQLLEEPTDKCFDEAIHKYVKEGVEDE